MGRTPPRDAVGAVERSLDAAVALAKGCPILNGGLGSIEVAETMAM